MQQLPHCQPCAPASAREIAACHAIIAFLDIAGQDKGGKGNDKGNNGKKKARSPFVIGLW